MRVLAIDPSEYNTGWIVGIAGSNQVPRAQCLPMRTKHQRMEDAVANLARWVRDRLEEFGDIGLVCAPAPLSPASFGKDDKFMSMSNIIVGQISLNAVIRGVCACYDVEFRSPPESSVRKHFCGRASANPPRKKGDAPMTPAQRQRNREATKMMVIERAQLLGYMDRDDYNDNRADASALYDYACAQYIHKPPPQLFMFGEEI